MGVTLRKDQLNSLAHIMSDSRSVVKSEIIHMHYYNHPLAHIIMTRGTHVIIGHDEVTRFVDPPSKLPTDRSSHSLVITVKLYNIKQTEPILLNLALKPT